MTKEKKNIRINVVMFLKQAINVYLVFKDILNKYVLYQKLCCIYRLCSTLF